MIKRENIFPDGLSKRVVKGHLLYTPVVTVVPGKLVFVSGILSRNANGEIVGKEVFGVDGSRGVADERCACGIACPDQVQQQGTGGGDVCRRVRRWRSGLSLAFDQRRHHAQGGIGEARKRRAGGACETSAGEDGFRERRACLRQS